MKRRLSPQEKKAYSLKKDRRNAYGENDKASRKAIRRNKRRVNRGNRRYQQSKMSEMSAAVDNDGLEDAENQLLKKAPKRWKKMPDITLAETIKHSRKWSILREGRKARSRAGKFEQLNVDDKRLSEFDNS